ncbi:hemerythrin domain-containing protein [Acidovorax sp. SRB_24]|uniref:hemerythrin domain-containing protein n=1 Tax=Acidovorax sp. SRB_24 TaxID=1962700 RepID=UPI00145EFE64|nr:hemerythrin domain-containing protein [Acidovorax sp. SRB_24]NMM77772.1 hemerythrin [Acidovorax sp. SRB_24]NMM77802.1 hemerythrin [Acidovorax sp. SRB_24]
MAGNAALPGFGAPAVGFDTPFEMLEACHERVQRTLALLQRLVGYLHGQACDDSARQAAHDVLLYFDLAAPLHHEDEELHVFPPLLAHGDAAMAARVRQLQQDHARMDADWQAARTALQALAEGKKTAFSAQDEAAFARFATAYAAHIRSEEDLVYPAARALLGADALQRMAQDMRQRRGAAP